MSSPGEPSTVRCRRVRTIRHLTVLGSPGTDNKGALVMLKDNIFKKIIDGQIKADIVFQDDLCLAFRDIKPQAPVHVIIIPRKEIPTHADITPADCELLGHLHLVAQQSGGQARSGRRLSSGCQLQGTRRADGAAFAPAPSGRATHGLAAGVGERTHWEGHSSTLLLKLSQEFSGPDVS